jgi:hypothetical protein
MAKPSPRVQLDGRTAIGSESRRARLQAFVSGDVRDPQEHAVLTVLTRPRASALMTSPFSLVPITASLCNDQQTNFRRYEFNVRQHINTIRT